MTSHNYAHREPWLHAVAARLAEPFADLGYPLPAKIRVTCGFPSVRGLPGKKQRIGECWSSTNSADEHHEILISPVISDPLKVAGTLAHELVHAAVGLEHGHDATFKKCATKIGLTGKMTATDEGEVFKATIAPILDAIGPYPHATLSAMTNGRKTQTTRMIKCECPDCGITAPAVNGSSMGPPQPRARREGGAAAATPLKGAKLHGWAT
jgi:hypothetical protein